jgi:hypothetical protein
MQRPKLFNCVLRAVLQFSHNGSLLSADWDGEIMKRADWILLLSWLVYVALLGPYLISARNDTLVITGLATLAVLLYFTQRRVVPILKEKLK